MLPDFHILWLLRDRGPEGGNDLPQSEEIPRSLPYRRFEPLTTEIEAPPLIKILLFHL